MTKEQWKKLVAVINGEVVEPLPVGFIIDSPWLPGWTGVCAEACGNWCEPVQLQLLPQPDEEYRSLSLSGWNTIVAVLRSSQCRAGICDF